MSYVNGRNPFNPSQAKFYSKYFELLWVKVLHFDNRRYEYEKRIPGEVKC